MIKVRAFYDSVSIESAESIKSADAHHNSAYSSAQLKIYYPSAYGDSDEERNTGVIPADADAAPFPVVIMMPGINVDPGSYSWLAKRLGECGIVTVIFQHVAEEMPGYISLTPGLDISALKPESFGLRPSSTVLTAIIAKLHKLCSQESGNSVLAGKLDLQSIILGGHSAGGTVAMLNANPDWFPGVSAAFCYGAHSGASVILGWPENTTLPLPQKVPLLIMGGTQDGCIANSTQRYGSEPDENSSTAMVEETFYKSLTDTSNQAIVKKNVLLLIRGANHFSMVHPYDDTTGRPFIDMPATEDEESIRQLMSDFILQFIHAQQPARNTNELLNTLVESYQSDPLVAKLDCR